MPMLILSSTGEWQDLFASYKIVCDPTEKREKGFFFLCGVFAENNRFIRVYASPTPQLGKRCRVFLANREIGGLKLRRRRESPTAETSWWALDVSCVNLQTWLCVCDELQGMPEPVATIAENRVPANLGE